MTQKSELCDKDFKVAVIKMIQQEIVNIPQTHKRIKSLSEETEDPNRSFRTKKYYKQNVKL